MLPAHAPVCLVQELQPSWAKVAATRSCTPGWQIKMSGSQGSGRL